MTDLEYDRRPVSQRPLIGYRSCRSGLNNQKISLLGLLSRAISTGSDIVIPKLVNFATDNRGVISEIPFSEIYDSECFVSMAQGFGVGVLENTVVESENFHQMFEIGSLVVRGRTKHDVELSNQFLCGLRPNRSIREYLDRLIDNLFSVRRIDATIQLRIEPDWQGYAATYMKVIEGEDRTASFEEILRKVNVTFGPNVRKLYVTCDENQVPTEEITAFAERELDLSLVWKSDILIEDMNKEDLCLRTTIDFELAVNSPIFIGTSRSTFANLICITKNSLSGYAEHYVYNIPGNKLGRRTDRGVNVDYREVTRLNEDLLP